VCAYSLRALSAPLSLALRSGKDGEAAASQGVVVLVSKEWASRTRCLGGWVARWVVGGGVQHLRTLHSDFAGLLAAATASLERMDNWKV